MTGSPIALMLGDRNGVGPELVAGLLADRTAANRPLVVVGDRAVLAAGARSAGESLDPVETGDFTVPPGAGWALRHRPHDAPAGPLRRVEPEAGQEVLDIMRELSAAALAGDISGIVYAPLNKQAMRLAGHEAGDELEWFERHMKAAGTPGEINILGDLWTSRTTSHIPLKDVASNLTPERVLDSIRLLDAALKKAGRTPKLALCALNPHAGEGGAYGTEEIVTLAPAIARARDEQIRIEGPFPADTIFPRAVAGAYDGVVTLFHDQGQIALKMVGLGKGVTMLAGLPVPVATPGHGTAYDIAGQGIARRDGLEAALGLVETMSE